MKAEAAMVPGYSLTGVPLLYTPIHPRESGLHNFSSIFKGKAIKLYNNSLIANGDKGYRSVLATQGVVEGTFYYELTVLNSSSENLNLPTNPIPPNAPMLEPLIPTHLTLCYDMHNLESILHSSAHTRIGFATAEVDLETPIGCDAFGYAYRDTDGAGFHMGTRQSYSLPYGPNDTIGCLIKLNPQKPKIKGRKDEGLTPSEGSHIRFFKNALDLGVCFSDIYEGCYYPAVALYQFARVEIAMGPEFKYPERLGEFQARPFYSL